MTNDYEKVFLKGWAVVKSFEWWEVIDVNIDVNDLIEKVRWKIVKTWETWTLRFSILKKKPEKIRDWESTHYLVHSYKMQEKKNPLESNTDDDLPF